MQVKVVGVPLTVHVDEDGVTPDMLEIVVQLAAQPPDVEARQATKAGSQRGFAAATVQAVGLQADPLGQGELPGLEVNA